MSAIQTVCEKCGTVYLAGVVGSWAWPLHVCGKLTGSEVYVPKPPRVVPARRQSEKEKK